MHQHQLDSGCTQQVEVVRQHREFAVGDHVTAKGDDEGLAAESVEVGRDGAEPADEARIGLGFGAHVCVVASRDSTDSAPARGCVGAHRAYFALWE